MAITPAEIQSLIEREMSLLQDVRIVAYIKKLLIEPILVMREWDYGDTEQTYPCWTVLSHVESNSGIAYCEFGFGPRSPWGLIGLSGENMSIGMDSGWFISFIQAYFDSFASADLPIWRVFKYNKDSESEVALTEESDWDSTWKEVYRLRSFDPDGRYNCSHSIQFSRE